MIKVVDFYADWCVDPQTFILLSNGIIKPAGEITTQDTIGSLNINDLKVEPRKVVAVKLFENKPSFRLTLETGRTLVADENHLVYTKVGWKKMSELNESDFVLVDPVPSGRTNPSFSKSIILKETPDLFSNRQLEKLGLLPLRESDEKLPVLARLVGALVTDGYLYEDISRRICEAHFSLGTDEDVKSVLNDLKFLGFNKTEVKKQKKERQIGGRKFVQRSFRVRLFSHPFFYLFQNLGVPVGRKKSQAYTVPNWIKRSPLEIKREFLSGWLGGDGSKISASTVARSPCHEYTKVGVNAIEFHKEKNLEKSGLAYAHELGRLFEQFGAGVNKIFSEADEDGVIISLSFNQSYNSFLNLSEIGYAYASTKQKQSALVGEFLRYRLEQRNIYSQKQDLVSVLSRRGSSIATIAEETGFSKENVTNTRFKQRHNLPFGLPKTGEAIYDLWIAGRRAKNGLLCEQVLKVEALGSRNVIGISVDAPHTLITNGVVSHNCGPCKMMAPIFEELEKELAGKVEFEKVNVDADQARAQQYGVLSIPTFIILKDDKEVDRTVGGRSREAFKTWIESHL